MKTEAEVRRALELIRAYGRKLKRAGRDTPERVMGLANIHGVLAWLLGEPAGQPTADFLAAAERQDPARN